ncbi:hypothetical protein DBL07_07250, partial [Achromobacter mucicolens]
MFGSQGGIHGFNGFTQPLGQQICCPNGDQQFSAADRSAGDGRSSSRPPQSGPREVDSLQRVELKTGQGLARLRLQRTRQHLEFAQRFASPAR